MIPGLGRSPGKGKGYPFQYSCLEDSMDRGAWQATVHGIAKRLKRLSILMRCWVSTPTPSAQGSSPARPGQAGLGFCRNGARYTPGPRGPGGLGAEAALPEAHSSRCLFPPLDRAEGRCARGRDVQEPRRRQCP